MENTVPHTNRPDDLAIAIVIASKAHLHQLDKAGQPYILHPLRLMLRLPAEDHDGRIVAVLHDVVEDTEVTLEDLHARGFSDAVVSAVDALSRRSHETYEEFIERIAPNPLAVRVKLEDLRDNMDLTRIKTPTPNTEERMERYRKAVASLEPLVVKP